jgi:hypothetical protein
MDKRTSDLRERRLRERRAANDRRVAADIKEYGCHVISVLPDPDANKPPFTYSVGIQESSGTPEAIVFGLTAEMGGFVINEYNRHIRAGARFTKGTLYPGFLKGFSVYMEPAQVELLREYTLGCERFYGESGSYSVVQIVYPNTSGVWPWQEEANAWFKANQPMLGRARPDSA